MQTNTAHAIAQCAASITESFDNLYAMVQSWGASVQDAFADQPLHSDALDSLIESLVRPKLREYRDSIIGAGFVAAPGLLIDAPWHLAWWLGERNTFEASAEQSEIRALLTVDDPSADGFRDYTSLEWWRAPVSSGRMHITGPYVDYLCTDDYTMTMTVPVYSAGALLGVVGADQYVTDIEREILPLLLQTNENLTLTNAEGRVVLSTDFTVATGTLLRGLDFVGFREDVAHQSPAVSARKIGDTDIWRCGNSTLYLLQSRALG